MKAWSLLFLRFGTGMLLVLWGTVRLTAPEAGAGVSDKYYSGLGSSELIQLAWGAALVAIGVLCILGLWRKFSYAAQAVVLVTGALFIWKYLVDPFGNYLLAPGESQLLFFPSVALAAATLVLIAFREEDTLTLDNSLRRGSRAENGARM